MKTIKLFLILIGCSFVKQTIAQNPCLPQVTITPIPNTYGCYSITASNGNPNDPDSYYQWHFTDGSNGTGKTIYHCCSPVTTTTNYTLSLNYNSPALCGPLPTYSVYTIVLSPPPSSLCVNNTASITLSANTVTVWTGVVIPEILFSFNYGDGSATSQTNTHTYANCGNYIIHVKEWDMNTPNDTCYSYAAVNISCGNANGIKPYLRETEVGLYPNPAQELLHIKTVAIISEIKVLDFLGKEILFSRQAKGQLNLDGLSPGPYFVKIKFENGADANLKFIKE